MIERWRADAPALKMWYRQNIIPAIVHNGHYQVLGQQTYDPSVIWSRNAASLVKAGSDADAVRRSAAPTPSAPRRRNRSIPREFAYRARLGPLALVRTCRAQRAPRAQASQAEADCPSWLGPPRAHAGRVTLTVVPIVTSRRMRFTPCPRNRATADRVPTRTWLVSPGGVTGVRETRPTTSSRLTHPRPRRGGTRDHRVGTVGKMRALGDTKRGTQSGLVHYCQPPSRCSDSAILHRSPPQRGGEITP